jgi:hypothetical protein
METQMLMKNGPEPRFLPSEDGIMELSLLMSRRQFEALEQRARADGMSVAQFLRRLVQETVEDELPLGLPD